jgi:predicted lipoprotein with Yx(FWY)xxD motif
MRHPRITIAATTVAVAAVIGGVAVGVAGGSSTPSYSSSASSSGTGASSPAGTATAQPATATVQGKSETILVDGKGLPLYTFKNDTPTISGVSGQLAALWPPLVASAPTARGVPGTVTTVATSNGKQVAYNGHFLYTFVEDTPGHVTGQGVQSFFVATPGLAAAGSSAPSAAPAQSSTGYGY